MSSPQPDWLFLDRLLAGECAPDELESFREWLTAHPESADALAVLRETLDRQVPADPATPTWNVEHAWARLDQVTREDAGSRHRLPPPLRRAGGTEVARPRVGRPRFAIDGGTPSRTSPWLRAAAAAVLLVGGAAAVSLWQRTSTPSGVAARVPRPRVIVTQRTERADLRLADGTHVILAPESRLTIPVDFGASRREIVLAGEGYFDVAHDSAKPFLVRAAHGVVHDLGTRFSVRAYPGDSAVLVVVAEGRVVTGLAGSGFPLRGPVLGQGDMARLDSAGTTTLTRGVDVDRYQSWIDGRLRFVAAPLRDVLPVLSRWYDLDFMIADPAIGSRRVTLTFRDEPLAQVISAIAQVTNTGYERIGGGVRFFESSSLPLAPRMP